MILKRFLGISLSVCILFSLCACEKDLLQQTIGAKSSNVSSWAVNLQITNPILFYTNVCAFTRDEIDAQKNSF